MRFVIAAAMVAGGLFASMQHASAFTGECLLQVEGKNYIDGRCDIEMGPGGSFTITAPTRRFAKGYFAIVNVERKGFASGIWNEEEGAKQAYSPLGTLTPQGACWQNAEAKVCAWKLGTRSQDAQRAAPVSEAPTATTSPNQSASIVAQGVNPNPVVPPQAPNGDEPVIVVYNHNRPVMVACVFGMPVQDFESVRKKMNVDYLTILRENHKDYSSINDETLSVFSDSIINMTCTNYMPQSFLQMMLDYANKNRGRSRVARDFSENYQRLKGGGYNITERKTRILVAAVVEENAFRIQQEKIDRENTERKAADERKQAEMRRLAEQERQRQEAEERQQAARKEKQARDDFIAGYRSNGAYWFLFAKVAVPLNRMCVVGETSGAVDSYATREIAAKVAKVDGGPDFSNLHGLGFQVVRRASFKELVASLTARSHEDRCDFAVAPFDDALSLASAGSTEFGAILARPFVFTQAEAASAEKEAQAEIERKREEKQREADAEAARQQAQRLRDEAEKKRAAGEYEARKEARLKQDAEERRVAALNAELERIKQAEAKELAERDAVRRAEQEKQQQLKREQMAKELEERDRPLREREANERAEREAAQRAEAERQERETKARAQREALIQAEKEKQELAKREQERKSRSPMVDAMMPNIASALRCSMSDASTVYLVKFNNKLKNQSIIEIQSDSVELKDGNESIEENYYKKSGASTYRDRIDFKTEIEINRTTLEANILNQAWEVTGWLSRGRGLSSLKAKGKCYQSDTRETFDKIVEIKEKRKSDKERTEQEEAQKKQKALSDRKI